MARNGKVRRRMATQTELQRVVTKSVLDRLWETTPRSQLVKAEVKEKRDVFGAWLDYGGKYYK